MARVLDEVDLAVVGALQVDGRASWRRIARAIGIPVSTVTRRGTLLLESGMVRVAALRIFADTLIVEVATTPTTERAVAELLAGSDDSIFVYVMSPDRHVLAEVAVDSSGHDFVAGQALAALPGVTSVVATPAIEYYRTVTEWMPGLISTESARAVRSTFGRPPQRGRPPADQVDEAIIAALVADGRAPIETVAALAGVSESSARRRMAVLLGRTIDVRAIVDPADVGLPVSALVKLAVPPAAMAEMAGALRVLPEVRYAVLTTGAFQLLVDVTLPSVEALRDIVTGAGWSAPATRIDSALVVAAYKRGGVAVSVG